MKKSTLSIALAALAAGAGLSIAQDDNLERTPPPLVPPVAPVPATPPIPPVREAQREAQRRAQLNANKDQLTESAKALAKSQKELAIAQATTVDGPYAQRLYGYSTSGPGRSLVIPKDANDAKSVSEVEEDLGVMAHILDKAVASDSKVPHAMGITVFGKTSFGGGAQNLYIEGYGAIFFLNVNYPLLPPPSKEKDNESKDKTSSEWEEARREIAHPGKPGSGDAFVLWEDRMDGPQWVAKGAEYDADKVDDLKKDVLTALKNAAHIRRLKSDETITVVVAGSKGPTVKSAKTGAGGKSELFVAKDGSKADSSKLIIRARKADAEAFQNGKTNFDDFRKRATVMLY